MQSFGGVGSGAIIKVVYRGSEYYQIPFESLKYPIQTSITDRILKYNKEEGSPNNKDEIFIEFQNNIILRRIISDPEEIFLLIPMNLHLGNYSRFFHSKRNRKTRKRNRKNRKTRKN